MAAVGHPGLEVCGAGPAGVEFSDEVEEGAHVGLFRGGGGGGVGGRYAV